MKGVQRKASEYAICEMKVYQSVDRSALKNAYEKAKTILKNTKVILLMHLQTQMNWQNYGMRL